MVITATGFNLSVLGDIDVHDRRRARSTWRRTVTYRGCMFTGVPNLVWVFGYFRASWTLRADLLCVSSAGSSTTWTSSAPTG